MLKQSNIYNPRHINFWIALTVLAGITLRTVQFFGNSSMSFDELTSALNIQSRTFYELATQSLDYNQVAPVGFLLCEKLATSIFGETDEAFRFFPWLWSLVSLFLFLLIAQRFLKGIYLLAAVILFAGATSQLIYAGAAKQYSGDVAFTLFLVWAALLMIKEDVKKGRAWLLALGGSFAILSSLPAIPLSLFLLCILSFAYFKNRLSSGKYPLLIIESLWLMSVLLHVCYAKFVISGTVRDAMADYWSFGFPPRTGIADYVIWFVEGFYFELNFFLFYVAHESFPLLTWVSIALLILSVLTFIHFVKVEKINTLILFSPFLIAIALAMAYILPYDRRLVIYASWPFIISGVAGIALLGQWKPQIFRPAFSASLAICIALVGVLITLFLPSERPPYRAQPSQPVLRELKKQMQPGDILFVYYRARHAVKFYGPQEGITDYIVGNDYNDINGYLRDIDSLRGHKRVWFFYSQWVPTKPYPDSMKKYMGQVIGKEIGHIPDPYGGVGIREATAYLYDLSGK